jgi:hypothetical protein
MKPDHQYEIMSDKERDRLRDKRLREEVADLWAFIEWLVAERYLGPETEWKIRELKTKWGKP